MTIIALLRRECIAQRRAGSSELWINYTAEATCLVRLESVEVLDGDAGDDATSRDEAVWVLDLSGNAYSSGSSIDGVASLRRLALDGDPMKGR